MEWERENQFPSGKDRKNKSLCDHNTSLSSVSPLFYYAPLWQPADQPRSILALLQRGQEAGHVLADVKNVPSILV